MTQNKLIYQVLSANRKKWVSILVLHKVSHSLSIATKISQLRAKMLDIENKQERQKNGTIHSWYRLNKWVLKW